MGNVVDTLEYVKELRAAGVPEQQAEAQAKALSKAVSEGLVTKDHFDLTLEKIDHRIEQLEYRLTIRMGGMIAAAIAALAAIMRLH